jgi:hypothetical protein
LIFLIHLAVLGTNLAHQELRQPATAGAAAGAFGFDAFLAKAPDVETARIARQRAPLRVVFCLVLRV